MRKALLLPALILGLVSPAFAAPPANFSTSFYGPPPSVPPPAPDRAYRRLVAELTELRRVAIEQQASDGGTLTPEHRDAIQVQIDAAFAAYRRDQN